MSDLKISQMNAFEPPLDGSETVPILQGANNVSCTTQDIADLASSFQPLYIAKFAKSYAAAQSDGYLSYSDGITLVQASADVIFDASISGFNLWRLSPGAYLVNMHIVHQGAGGTGGLSGSTNTAGITTQFELFPNGENVAHRQIFDTLPIPANSSRSFFSRCLSGIVIATNQATQGFYLGTQFDWGNTVGVNIDMFGFLLIQRIAPAGQPLLVD